MTAMLPDASTELAAFVARVGALAGPPDERTRVAAVMATLRALARRLTTDERAWLAPALPLELRPALSAPADVREPDVSAGATHARRSHLFHEVRRETGLPLGRAIEAVEVVCRVVAEYVAPTRRARLSALASRDLAGLFELATTARSPAVPTPRGNLLATGAPGSRHPLSQAATRAGQPGSVARWDGSPAARTLAGYRGSARAIAGETLATGRPGSRRTLADGRTKSP